MRRGLRLIGRAALFAVIAAALASAPAAAAMTCGGTATAAGVGRPEPWLAWRGQLSATAPVYARPGGPRTASVTPADASALLVLAARERAGRCWVRVRLPSRPNTASGWVNAERLELSSTNWRLVVHRGSRRLDVLRHGRLVRRVAIVVGAPLTPTPRGLFAVAGAWEWRPRDFLGAWVLTLTAHSDVLQHFDGGDGRVALHGRGGASLADPLGSARSHGCVRIANSAISWLARTIGHWQLPGTPVVVN
jgi:lipoprotein-anchoring transpeptidase ErfK/SrfK